MASAAVMACALAGVGRKSNKIAEQAPDRSARILPLLERIEALRRLRTLPHLNLIRTAILLSRGTRHVLEVFVEADLHGREIVLRTRNAEGSLRGVVR